LRAGKGTVGRVVGGMVGNGGLTVEGAIDEDLVPEKGVGLDVRLQ